MGGGTGDVREQGKTGLVCKMKSKFFNENMKKEEVEG